MASFAHGIACLTGQFFRMSRWEQQLWIQCSSTRWGSFVVFARCCSAFLPKLLVQMARKWAGLGQPHPLAIWRKRSHWNCPSPWQKQCCQPAAAKVAEKPRWHCFCPFGAAPDALFLSHVKPHPGTVSNWEASHYWLVTMEALVWFRNGAVCIF